MPCGRSSGTTPACTRLSAGRPGWRATTTGSRFRSSSGPGGSSAMSSPWEPPARRRGEDPPRGSKPPFGDPDCPIMVGLCTPIRRTHDPSPCCAVGIAQQLVRPGRVRAGSGLGVLRHFPGGLRRREAAGARPAQHPADRGHREVPDGARQRRRRHRGRVRLDAS